VSVISQVNISYQTCTIESLVGNRKYIDVRHEVSKKWNRKKTSSSDDVTIAQLSNLVVTSLTATLINDYDTI
jgi:hypothetical protein